jgi:hypothetical protein
MNRALASARASKLRGSSHGSHIHKIEAGWVAGLEHAGGLLGANVARSRVGHAVLHRGARLGHLPRKAGRSARAGIAVSRTRAHEAQRAAAWLCGIRRSPSRALVQFEAPGARSPARRVAVTNLITLVRQKHEAAERQERQVAATDDQIHVAQRLGHLLPRRSDSR